MPSILRLRRSCVPLSLLPLLAAAFVLPVGLSGQETQPSKYRGWDTLKLANGLVELQVVAKIGGRVMQLKLG